VSAGFTRAAFRLGVQRSLPLTVGLAPFGLVVGVIAQGQGLSLAEVTLMSALCYAGSAQFLALSHWSLPAPILAATLAALIVNLRLALMGPVLAPWLNRVRGWKLLGSLFMMADQNWAMSVEHMRRGEGDAAFLFSSGFTMWVVWVVTTMLGHAAGSLVRPPPGHPIFFATLAIFIALLTRMWRGRMDALPWVVAGLVSALAARVLPGTWYIVIGALAGSFAGVLRDRLRT
jgi:4-azaleucine resistance transporter AzlC